MPSMTTFSRDMNHGAGHRGGGSGARLACACAVHMEWEMLCLHVVLLHTSCPSLERTDVHMRFAWYYVRRSEEPGLHLVCACASAIGS